MKPHVKPPTVGRLCRNQPLEYFSHATTPTQIQTGKQICATCPQQQQCLTWVTQLHQHHNPHHNPYRDIIVQGVIAGHYWNATDGRGRPLHITTLDNTPIKPKTPQK